MEWRLQLQGQGVGAGGAVGQRAAVHEAGEKSCQDLQGWEAGPDG